MRPCSHHVLLSIVLLFLLGACAKQPQSPQAPARQIQEELVVKTMVTGIDQFDGGTVLGLNTGHGVFVVGPEVSQTMKDTVYEHLMKAHDRVVTIRYRDMPASRETVAHKRVTAIVVDGTAYRLTH